VTSKSKEASHSYNSTIPEMPKMPKEI